MIRIMFVIDHLGYGGAQKMLLFVASHLNKNVYETLIYLKNGDDKTDYSIDDNISIICGRKREKRYIRRFQEIGDLIGNIKKYKPDIIISFLNIPNLIATIAGFVCRIPVIISERGDPARNVSFIRQVECLCSGAVFQTKAAQAFYPKTISRKGIVIPNPVVKNKEHLQYKFNSQYKKVAFIARFELVQKRQDIMLYSFKKVLNKFPEMKLYFYGDGTDEEVCKKLALELGISKNILFCGRVQNPLEQIMDAYMFVLTSDYEGIPNALIEAMAAGIPVVSTDCSPGGAALLIKNKKNGLLVPVGDIQGIADAMIYLLEHPKQAERYGKNGTSISEIYSEKKIIKMWDEYIIKIIQRK